MANIDQRTEALTILMEECAELIQATSKVLRFGPDAQSANGANSLSELQTQELADLFAIIRIAEEHGAICCPDEQQIQNSMIRKRKYSSL